MYLQVFHQDIPNGDDVTEASCEDEEVEDRMHIALMVKGVEDGSCDVAHALGYNPYHGSCGDGVDERLESNQYRESHADEAKVSTLECSFSRIKLMMVPAMAHSHTNEKSPQPQ